MSLTVKRNSHLREKEGRVGGFRRMLKPTATTIKPQLYSSLQKEENP